MTIRLALAHLARLADQLVADLLTGLANAIRILDQVRLP